MPNELPAKLSLVAGPENLTALAVAMPELKGYQYLPLATEGSPERDVLHFRACGDAETKYLCLQGPGIRGETEQFLRKTFLPHVTPDDAAWWRGGEGRNVQALDGLAYFCDAIDKDPEVRAALLRATWHVVSPQSLCGLPRVLAREELTSAQWMYLNFAAVTLPDLVQPEIVRKRP